MSAPPDLPAVVARAHALSRQRGFVSSCRNETGRLLASLAASRTGTLAESGTGCGVGSAWLRSGMREGSKLVTVERDAGLVEAVREIFADDQSVTVLEADWTELAPYGPFSLLFLDVREAKRAGPDTVADLVEPGGFVVLDDFTPCATWPPMFQGRVDTMRQVWLTDPRFTTVEVMVAFDASVLIATRR
ncbi:O-methyltransferase [Thermasporomyces composti]|jgi:predicted O-methyltransferase YrrM|uniref:Putative O-methyltransferase YrrM n=1 Tax=Thermasporomyces composti TaxID=696763 RepID=A0A3D9V1A8_THECX|nr:class I SAM-dependent methyltransferase [Thermasporomyces composti]REF35249.1 putative O-methyltransferase YrrM [Thermasporomyces composti]